MHECTQVLYLTLPCNIETTLGCLHNTYLGCLDTVDHIKLYCFLFFRTPAAGYFNDDDTPDFFVRYNHGKGFPVYYYSEVHTFLKTGS